VAHPHRRLSATPDPHQDRDKGPSLPRLGPRRAGFAHSPERFVLCCVAIAAGGDAFWGHQVLTSEYHLKQAGVAARMALAEPDPTKAAAFHVLALEHFAKAKLTEWAPDQSDELRRTRPRTGAPEEED
jgi:hypothetical protein